MKRPSMVHHITIVIPFEDGTSKEFKSIPHRISLCYPDEAEVAIKILQQVAANIPNFIALAQQPNSEYAFAYVKPDPTTIELETCDEEGM